MHTNTKLWPFSQYGVPWLEKWPATFRRPNKTSKVAHMLVTAPCPALPDGGGGAEAFIWLHKWTADTKMPPSVLGRLTKIWYFMIHVSTSVA